VNTWKGNEFLALASDTNFAMMVVRHMYEFGTTVEQLAKVSIKNHGNAIYNPYSQSPSKLTVEEVRSSPMVAYPLTMLDICTMSDGAAVCILASKEKAFEFCDKPIKITGVGTGTDTMRLSDRPRGKVILLPWESEEDYEGLEYPGVHSCRAGRIAAKMAYEQAGIINKKSIDFVELYDSYTSSEIQAYEDLGLCKYGEGGLFIEKGYSELDGKIPVNPSGGLLACGHPIGATGLMQAVFAFWQLQGTIEKHLGNNTLQIKNARRGIVHSHAGTGTYVTVNVMERGF
ncbi:MAG: hypothetical protein ACE5J9_08650, partial [Methanosarcinales archaeon]